MKKAIVIGGTSGIGQGVTKMLLKNEYEVIVTGTKNCLKRTALKPSCPNLSLCCLDCTTDNTSEKIHQLITKLGGLDLLVYSAGIGNLNKDIGYTVENKANLVNVIAFTEAIDYTYRYFDKQGYGHIVGITSFSSLFPSRVAPAYHAAKAYQASYLTAMRQKANKAKKPITITEIKPGFVHTPLTEGKKMFWACSSEKAGKLIYKDIAKKHNLGYVSRRWRLAACIIKIVPAWVKNHI